MTVARNLETTLYCQGMQHRGLSYTKKYVPTFLLGMALPVSLSVIQSSVGFSLNTFQMFEGIYRPMLPVRGTRPTYVKVRLFRNSMNKRFKVIHCVPLWRL